MQAMAPFLAGLGLFFCGVHFLSSHLVPLAGRQMRLVLMKVGDRPLLAALIGAFAGAVTQSTNAVAAVVIGLVSGGLVDKRRAILIPTWSHIGTSLLVILVAIDFRLASSDLLALAGIGVYFGLDRNDRARHTIGTLLGLGLLFFGMQLLKSGTEPLRDTIIQGGYLALAVGHPSVLLLVGAGLALACQSSPVAGALAVAAASAGLIDLSGAAWIVYGANLGSGVNFVIFARPYHGEAKQIALLQAVQKVAGFTVVLVVIIIGGYFGKDPINAMAEALADNISGQIAWQFLLFQIVGSTVCTLLLGRILPLLERIAPPSTLQELSRPAFLTNDALVAPSLALELAEREESRLLARLPAMLDGLRAEVEGPVTPHEILRRASLAVTGAMAGYLGAISDADLDRGDRERVVRLQHRTANLVALFEGLDEFVAACVVAREWPSSRRVADQMIEALHTLLTALAEATQSSDPEDREIVLTLLAHRDELMEKVRRRLLREEPDIPAKPQEGLFTATMLFERVIWFARRNALLLTPERAAGGEQFAVAS
jgi:phosphate:Na+ symporter